MISFSANKKHLGYITTKNLRGLGQENGVVIDDTRKRPGVGYGMGLLLLPLYGLAAVGLGLLALKVAK